MIILNIKKLGLSDLREVRNLVEVQTIELGLNSDYLISYLFSKTFLLKYNIQTKMHAGPKWKVLKSLLCKHFM